MVWENGCTVIVMMTALVEDGEKQCERYWPDEGSSLYHIYEVGAVSPQSQIYCVRSFFVRYLTIFYNSVLLFSFHTFIQFVCLTVFCDDVLTV